MAAADAAGIAEPIGGMMGHTPGPWEWDIRPKTKTFCLIAPHGGRMIVMDFVRWGMQSAQPCFSDRNGERRGGIMEEGSKIDLSKNPDACLIAAAPEILEALVYLVEAIESSMYGEEGLHTWQCGAPDHGRCSCDAYPAMDVARAAIAKAKVIPHAEINA